MKADGLLRIGELAKRTHKTVRALHLYEERGLLTPADRSQGGFRLYDAENVARIEFIDRLQKIGLKLKDIQALVQRWDAGDSPREAMAALKAVYQQKIEVVRAEIRGLQSLERDLAQSLGFLEGCGDCTREAEAPKAACGNCARSERGEGLTLITGMTGR